MHGVAAFLIVSGGSYCFLTVPHYDGVMDDCPASPDAQPTCDKFVWWGEAIYFAAWFLSSVVTLHAVPYEEQLYYCVGTFLLIFGPVQILVVYDLMPSGGAALSERLFTAVTYKIAVCSNLLSIWLISTQRLAKLSGKQQQEA
eukprot:CAMPEP_0118662140 /NCGR_PEP_ID=MMETSP0785-20121206/16660_1 /TAXON_ID=91992 /ORGANISM="Bolidomonas pacifica, Strain CCMP 1866" /LENGTH=142 /DNA_ID=CAMNT_0006555639 /DNA_START=335 /DNA_END=760 /DNA_ORIENTATION=-